MGPALVMQVQDFLGTDDLARYVHFVDGVLPIPNADGCEDVVGGLQVGMKAICSTPCCIATPL